MASRIVRFVVSQEFHQGELMEKRMASRSVARGAAGRPARLHARNGRQDRSWPSGGAFVVGAVVVGIGMLSSSAVAHAEAPAGRAYERVSPAERLSGGMPGLSTDLYAMPGRSADTGDRLVYGAGARVGETWSGAANPMIFGERTTTGWRARTAIRSMDDGVTPLELSSHEQRAGWLSPDGREFVFGTGKPLDRFVPGALAGVFRSVDEPLAPDWLSRPEDSVSVVGGVSAGSVTAGDENRTVVFQSTAPLTIDAPPAGTSAVYAYRNGSLQIASRLPDGSVASGASLANSGASTPNAAAPPARVIRGQLADGGRYVLFLHGGTVQTGSLYVRDLDAGVTRQLAGGGTGAPAAAIGLREAWGVFGSTIKNLEIQTVPNGAVFGARDASRAFFATGQSVGTTNFLYEANLETGVVTPRPALTGPPLGLSPDGQKMLFVEGPPIAGNSSPAGNWTLRYWDAANPTTSVVVGTIAVPASNPTYGFARVYEPSEDGRSWVFAAIGSPDPSRPNVTPTTRQLYRWTVGDAAPTCLSCQPVDGIARTAGVNLSVQDSVTSEGFLAPTTAISPSTNTSKPALAEEPHGLSDDGRWLLFDSPDQLVSEDTNNVRDVYLWDRDGGSGGRLQLVTSGLGTSPSWALDLSPDGKNAFFSTREGLVPADTDGGFDVYSARIGGGFPDSPESCSGEACRPPVIPDPPHDRIDSSRLTDVPAGPQGAVQQGTPKLRVRSVRTSASRVTVRVDTPGAGKIRISGSRVRTTNRTAKRATTYTVHVPLSAKARRTVARGRSVKVSLQVRFTPSGSSKASRVSTSVSVKKGR